MTALISTLKIGHVNILFDLSKIQFLSSKVKIVDSLQMEIYYYESIYHRERKPFLRLNGIYVTDETSD